MDRELDQLKSSLRKIDMHMEGRHILDLDARHRNGSAHIQWGLWPLWLGQCLQVLLGICCIVLGVSTWTAAGSDALVWSGISVHVYGVACMALGAVALGMLARVDRAAPLLQMQLHLANLRRFHILAGLLLGLSWWWFWIPFLAALLHWMLGVDPYAGMDMKAAAAMLLAGIAGMAATLWLLRRIRRGRNQHMAMRMDAALTGATLLRAQRQLDELRAFAG